MHVVHTQKRDPSTGKFVKERHSHHPHAKDAHETARILRSEGHEVVVTEEPDDKDK